MYKNHYNVIQSEKTGKRTHRITLLVQTRPDDPAEFINYFVAEAEKWAEEHDAKIISRVDVSLNPFRESAVLFFEVKAWKHPEKHKYVFNFTGTAAKPKKHPTVKP